MKLAVALSERSDIQRRLSELSDRLANNAKVQEGDTPAEDPKELLKEMDVLINRLEDLIFSINITNSQTFSDGTSMTLLLAKRDCMKKRLAMLRGFLDCASSKVDRYSRTEIAVHSTVDVAALQKEADRLSKELRCLDEKIQQLNWTTDLISEAD